MASFGNKENLSIVTPLKSTSRLPFILTSVNRNFSTPNAGRGGTRNRTPWTGSSRNTGISNKSNGGNSNVSNKMVVAAIIEGRGQARGEVAIANLGLTSPTLILSEFTDGLNYTKTLSKLNIYQPSKILLAASACTAAGQNRMYKQIEREFNQIEIIQVQRRFFNSTKGMTKIRQLVNEECSSVPLNISKKYYLLAAAAALFEYLELVRSINFVSKSLKMEFQGSERTALIDPSTVKHLELLMNNNDPTSQHSLLGVLDTCKTPGGSRLLRANILQPPFDRHLINQRLECVEELRNSPEFMYSLQANLSKVSMDLEHVISNLIQIPRSDTDIVIEQRSNFTLTLKHVLQRFPSFAEALKQGTQPYFQHLSREFELPVFGDLSERISSVINEEAQVLKGATNMSLQRTFAVKAKVNEMLDVARKVYCEIKGDVNDYVLLLSREHGLPLQICENPRNGLFLQFKLNDADSAKKLTLPRGFLKVRRSKNTVAFTTEELLITEQRVKELLREISHLSDIVISQLITDIRQEIGSLYKISEAIANLDLLHAFAVYATFFRSVRPNFSKFVTCITNGRHPILDSISFEPPVPNDTFLSSDVNLHVITGPNMSGKTTYLKQVALLQIMAQIGCFVPADSATFRIASCIFSRLGSDDNIEGDASSFAVEMNEMNFILRNITGSSLVIIDELGRATSIEEGIAMSQAMVESLLQSKAFILFATHFLSLTKMESLHLNALNYKMETVEVETLTQNSWGQVINSKLRYIHVFSRGVTEVENYGLKLAKMSAFPTSIVERAAAVARKIKQSQQLPDVHEAEKMTRSKLLYILGSSVSTASDHLINGTSVDDVKKYLQLLQAEFAHLHVQDEDDSASVLVLFAE